MVRRSILIACASLLALPVAARAAVGPRASAQLNRCHPSLDAAQRYAVFSGSMRSLRAGGDRMDMRFDLFRRAPGAFAFKRVAAPGLGVWNHADPGVGRFKFKQKVENLGAPATYRALVRFRWLNARGGVFTRARHLTPICQQPDLRPNLRIGRIVPPAVGRTYSVTVRNDGLTAAHGFDVSLSVGGVPVVPTQTVGLLGAGQRITLQFTGPRSCSGPVVATADPGGAVSETNEADNQRTEPCPAVSTTSRR